MSFNPLEPYPVVEKSDIEPGDEVAYSFEATQMEKTTYYVHTIMPTIDGETEWSRKKQQQEFDLILDRNRTFHMVRKHNENHSN